jgi:hypothetical protein
MNYLQIAVRRLYILAAFAGGIGLLVQGCAGPFAKTPKAPEVVEWEMGTPIVGYYHGPGGAPTPGSVP